MIKSLILLFGLSLFFFHKTYGQDAYTDSLKRKLNSVSDDSSRYKLLYAIAFQNMFNYADTATNYALQALEIAQKQKNKHKEGNCMGSLCVSLAVQGNYLSALDFGFKGLAIFSELKDTISLLYCHLQLMYCYEKQEEYKDALEHGYKAKSLFSFSALDTTLAGLILSVISSVYEKSGNLDSALIYAKNAKQHYPDWSGTFLTLGNIFAKKQISDSALSYYRSGAFFSTNDYDDINSVYLVDIYNNMSKVFLSVDKLDSAVYYAKKSILRPGVNAYPEGLLIAATQLANLYKSSRQSDSAIKYLTLAGSLRDSLYNKEKIREVQNFAFNKKLHQQELLFQKRQEESKLKIYILLGLALIFLLTGFFLLRNNMFKQKAKAKIEKAYIDLKSTQAQLIQSEKMASLGELTAGIAHEIQNPLNFANNFSDVNAELIDELRTELATGNIQLASEIADDIKGNEQKINHHGKKADSIVKGMLQHSKQSSGKKEPTDINALCDEYLRLAYHGLRAKDKSFNAKIETDFDNSIGKINLIPQEIGRVILNLINNAFYTVTEKKKENIEGYEPTVTVTTMKSNGKIEIIVKDNGTGIPQKIMDKIFQPLFTTKPTGQGTGLGLSLSYDIVKAHGGEINVKSKDGEGSEFTISFPIA